MTFIIIIIIIAVVVAEAELTQTQTETQELSSEMIGLRQPSLASLCSKQHQEEDHDITDKVKLQ